MTPPTSAIETVGQGPDLLCIHGTATDATTFRPLAALLEHRMRVTLYHRRGTPAWAAEGATTVEAHVQDAADLIRGPLGGGPVHVFGASFGGVIALDLARREPALVKTLAVYEPGLTIDGPHTPAAAMLAEVEKWLAQGRAEEAAAAFFRRVMPGVGWERLPGEARERVVGMVGHVRDDLRASAGYRVGRGELGGIEIPVVLMRGGRARSVFERVVAELQGVLRGARVEVMEGAEHQLSGRGWGEVARVELERL